MQASASSSQSLSSSRPLRASLSSLSIANTLSELDLHAASISKRQVFAQAIAIAVFYGFKWTLAANVPAAAIIFYVIFSPVILNYYLPTQLAAFSFPQHNQSRYVCTSNSVFRVAELLFVSFSPSCLFGTPGS